MPFAKGGFLHNTRIAWEMGRGIGFRYLEAYYLCPPGWQAVEQLSAEWCHHEDGYYLREPRKPRKAVAK